MTYENLPKPRFMINNPKEIELKSFKIIDGFLSNLKLPKFQKEVVKRAIHATAYFDYARKIVFSPDAIKIGIDTIRKGKNIIVDTNMVKAGINKKILTSFGGRAICFINNKNILKQSSKSGLTCAMLSMRKSVKLMNGGIVAIGNAPTALFELCDLIGKGKANPSLVIGFPVGFVGAKESKRKLISLKKVEYITNRGRFGGSSVAASIVNALLHIAKRKDDK